MPRQETIVKTYYTFEELSDKAKENARKWYRHASQDDEFWEFVYEDAVTCAAIMGIDINTRPVKLCGGGTRQEPDIRFSGFWYPEDGACFTGAYSYKKGAAKAIRQHAPADTELHRIADGLQALQRANFYQLTAQIEQSGRYSHARTMSVSTNRGTPQQQDELRDFMRDFADWIYARLEAEYDYRHADEQVDENIIANEYEFDETGERA